MTDYYNPEVRKKVVAEARETGIFNNKLDIKLQYHIFTLKVSQEDHLTLDMINCKKNLYKGCVKSSYKLKQVIFYLGAFCLYKPKRTYIKLIKKTLLGRYKYEIKCLIETKTVSERMWNKVNMAPLKLFFQDKKGFIEIINPIRSKFKIKEIIE